MSHFRILFRAFLFRITEVESLSTAAHGDSHRLLGQFAALLIFLSIGLAIPAAGITSSSMPAAFRLAYAWGGEHMLISTAMLAGAVFGILSWDSSFPDRLDLQVLSPLPVRLHTLLLAKICATAAGLGLAVTALNFLPSLAWPLAIGWMGEPAISYPRLGPPAATTGTLEDQLLRELAPSLAPESGVVVGILEKGGRRVTALGAARRDSIFQAGSVTKTFTGLLLAEAVQRGEVRLDQPVREILSPMSSPPGGTEITLRDLATHRSGLPPMPDNVSRDTKPNPGAAYRAEHLRSWVARQGLARAANPPFVYSNGGFALLGDLLETRSGRSYGDLVATRIAAPMGLRDTAVELTAEQQHRVISGFSLAHVARPPWTIGALTPAGGLYSTVDDLLTYLDWETSRRTAAIRMTQAPRGEPVSGFTMGLAWIRDEATGVYWHNGAISGYTSYIFFHPDHGYAGVVLANQEPSPMPLTGVIARHLRERLGGESAIPLAYVSLGAPGGWFAAIRHFAVYWTVLLLACAFVYCTLLLVQGLPALLLPRAAFLRVSPLLQMASLAGVVCLYFLQPRATSADALVEVSGTGLAAWNPTFWYLGLFQQLAGSAALETLARRAWLGTAGTLFGAALVTAANYRFTLNRMAEQPDLAPRSSWGAFPAWLSGGFQAAVTIFAARTLVRGKIQRLISAFYLGLGFAFVILMAGSAPPVRPVDDAPVTSSWGQVSPPLLAATIAFTGFAILAVRITFSFPKEPSAAWIFRLTGNPVPAESVSASRRVLLLVGAAPVWIGSAAACLWLWPWQQALGHAAILAGLGAIMIEISLRGFHRIPYTCTWLPGQSQIHMAVLGGLGLLWSLGLSIRHERRLLEKPLLAAATAGILFAIASIARWRVNASASREEAVEFEDAGEPAVRQLGLGE